MRKPHGHGPLSRNTKTTRTVLQVPGVRYVRTHLEQFVLEKDSVQPPVRALPPRSRFVLPSIPGMGPNIKLMWIINRSVMRCLLAIVRTARASLLGSSGLSVTFHMWELVQLGTMFSSFNWVQQSQSLESWATRYRARSHYLRRTNIHITQRIHSLFRFSSALHCKGPAEARHVSHSWIYQQPLPPPPPHHHSAHPSLVVNMKFASILTVLATTIASTTASECTYSQLMSLSSDPAVLAGNAACAGDQIDINKVNSANTQSICKNTKCVDAMKGALGIIPDCELQGQNLQAAFKKVLSACDSAQSSGVRAAPSGTNAAIAAAAAVAVVAYGRI